MWRDLHSIQGSVSERKTSDSEEQALLLVSEYDRGSGDAPRSGYGKKQSTGCKPIMREKGRLVTPNNAYTNSAWNEKKAHAH